jgi:hypothetical protein
MPTCRPGKCLGWPSARDKRNTAKVAKDIHIAASSVKPLRGARHQRFGTGTTRSHPRSQSRY